MIRINIADAKTHLSDDLEQLADGREDWIVVCKRNTPVAERQIHHIDELPLTEEAARRARSELQCRP